jgi:hypothetical protein
MLRLTATFKVSLANPLSINRPPQQERVRTIPPLRYDSRIDDSDVEITVLEIHPAMTQGDRTIWAVPEVRVSVSRSETVDPLLFNARHKAEEISAIDGLTFKNATPSTAGRLSRPCAD